jgi:hypothetical protein
VEDPAYGTLRAITPRFESYSDGQPHGRRCRI